MTRKYTDLDYIFHPKSVAVVGVSPDPVQWGLIDPFIGCGFPGKLYPVHPNYQEVLGLKVYKSIKDIPGTVDYVVFGTPASSVPFVLQECALKGVKVVSFFTAGFSESGTEGGRRLEGEILNIARQSGIRLIGPNCLGLYCPRSRIGFIPDPPLEPGPVGFISQSGGNSIYFIRTGAARGLLFSKVISYGNGVDIDESELLEYMASDPETEIIAVYVEGVKNGRRFCQALQKAASVKPVIVLKSGQTGAGVRSCASHTGAMAGDWQVWDAAVRQSGALMVDSMEEMVDLAVTFRYMRHVTGRRAGVVGWGGGASVLAADVCEAEGLIVPPFPALLQAELIKYFPAAGSILTNPVDSVSWTKGSAGYQGIIKAVANWDGIDILILQAGLVAGLLSDKMMLEFYPKLVDIYLEGARNSPKPAAIILHSNVTSQWWTLFYQQAQRCFEAGIPVYHSFQGAVRAISRYYRYCLRMG